MRQQVLLEYSDATSSLVTTYEEMSNAQDCDALAEQWNEVYGNPVSRIHGISDEQLANFYVDLLDASLTFFLACADGSHNEALKVGYAKVERSETEDGDTGSAHANP